MGPRPVVGLLILLKLFVSQVQRLPFLPSSNLSLDILRGNDETIGFEDILNGEWHSALRNPILYKVTAASRLSQGRHGSHLRSLSPKMRFHVITL